MIQSLRDSMTQFLLLVHPYFTRPGALRAADGVWRDQDQELIVLFLFGTLRGEEAESRDFGKRGQTAQAPLLGRSDHSRYDRRLAFLEHDPALVLTIGNYRNAI